MQNFQSFLKSAVEHKINIKSGHPDSSISIKAIDESEIKTAFLILKRKMV